jgi:integrase
MRLPACPYVFHRRGRRIVRFDTAWEAACTVAGLGGLHFHDLRRSGARNLRRAGVAETVIMRMGGWKTRSTFMRYDITSDADLVDAADADNAFLDQSANTSRKVMALRRWERTDQATG